MTVILVSKEGRTWWPEGGTDEFELVLQRFDGEKLTITVDPNKFREIVSFMLGSKS